MMMRAEDLHAPDTFWSVRERERQEEEALEREIFTLQAQLDTTRRVEALRHQPGFEDFLTAVKAMHAVEREKLVGDSRLTNEGLREVRGGVRKLESVLALLTKPAIGEALASSIVERKNALAAVRKRRPQPKQESTQ